MKHADWLALVATHNGAPPSRVGNYRALDRQLRKDFPALAATVDTAKAVADRLGGRFPTSDELREAVRAVMAESGDAEPEKLTMTGQWLRFYRKRIAEGGDETRLRSLLRAVCPEADAILAGERRERAEAEADLAWWTARVDAIADLPSATLALRAANGMLRTLTRPDAVDRPAIIERLMNIRRNCIEEGGAPFEEIEEAVPSPAPAAQPKPRTLSPAALLPGYRAAAEQGHAAAAERVRQIETTLTTDRAGEEPAEDASDEIPSEEDAP